MTRRSSHGWKRRSKGVDAVFAARRRRNLADFAAALCNMLRFERRISPRSPFVSIAILPAFGYDVAKNREGPA